MYGWHSIDGRVGSQAANELSLKYNNFNKNDLFWPKKKEVLVPIDFTQLPVQYNVTQQNQNSCSNVARESIVLIRLNYGTKKASNTWKNFSPIFTIFDQNLSQQFHQKRGHFHRSVFEFGQVFCEIKVELEGYTTSGRWSWITFQENDDLIGLASIVPM